MTYKGIGPCDPCVGNHRDKSYVGNDNPLSESEMRFIYINMYLILIDILKLW